MQLAEQTDVTQAARVAAEEQEHRKDIRKERLRQMQEYADTSTCQREHLLRYFDDEFTAPCNKCDNCEAATLGIKVDPSVGIRREVA